MERLLWRSGHCCQGYQRRLCRASLTFTGCMNKVAATSTPAPQACPPQAFRGRKYTSRYGRRLLWRNNEVKLKWRVGGPQLQRRCRRDEAIDVDAMLVTDGHWKGLFGFITPSTVGKLRAVVRPY